MSRNRNGICERCGGPTSVEWVRFCWACYLEETSKAKSQRVKKRCHLCEKEVVARGLCGMHYRRLRVHGDPEKVAFRRRTLQDVGGLARVLKLLDDGFTMREVGRKLGISYCTIQRVCSGRKRTLRCECCGREFTTKRFMFVKFCSRRCKNAVRIRRKRSYESYSPHSVCPVCGGSKSRYNAAVCMRCRRGPRESLVGREFGCLSVLAIDAVLAIDESRKRRQYYWICRCKVCGGVHSYRTDAIREFAKRNWKRCHLCKRTKEGYERLDSHNQIWIKMPEHELANKAGYVLKAYVVWEEHYGERLGMQNRISYIDGDRANLNVSNLRLIPLAKRVFRCEVCGKSFVARLSQKRITCSRKCSYIRKTHRISKFRKLSDQQARDILVREKGGEPKWKLAREYGVSPLVVKSIVRGKTYREIGGPNDVESTEVAEVG